MNNRAYGRKTSTNEDHSYGVSIGRIQSDVTNVKDILLDMRARQEKELEKLDLRITSVEKFMWRMGAYVSLIPFIAAAGMWLIERYM